MASAGRGGRFSLHGLRLLRDELLKSYNQRQGANEGRHSGWVDHGDHGSQPSGYDHDAWQREHSALQRALGQQHQLPQDEQEEQEVFSQLCAMLRNIYFQREHQLLASYTPDKEALWQTVRKIEDDFAAMAQEIKDEALIAFGKSDWSSNQPHLTNPRQRGLDHSRFRRCHMACSLVDSLDPRRCHMALSHGLQPSRFP
jgi:hypothetical protein